MTETATDCVFLVKPEPGRSEFPISVEFSLFIIIEIDVAVHSKVPAMKPYGNI